MSTHETDQTSSSVTWDPNIDLLLAGWCDNAKCFEWMHTEAHSIFESRAKHYMITMNCLTAVAGLSNIIAGGTQIGTFQVSWIFGGLSILVSTLNIIQDKLGYQQASALHQKSANEWATIRSKITEVLTIPYAGRKDCKTFLRYSPIYRQRRWREIPVFPKKFAWPAIIGSSLYLNLKFRKFAGRWSIREYS